MPDMIQPVGAMVNTPNPQQGLQSLSAIFGLKQQQQALQTGAAVLQSKQLEAGQLQGVQNFFSTWDPTQHFADDGTTDLDSALQSNEFKGAGNAKPAIMQALLDVKQKQLANKQALTTLNGDNVKQFATGMGALAKDDDVVADKTDPATGVNAGRAKVDQFIQNFSKLGPDAARVAQIYAPAAQRAPPGKLSSIVQAMQMQGEDVAGQQSQQNPAQLAVQRGGSQDVYNVNKSTGLQSGQQPVASIQNTPTPGESLPKPYTTAKNQTGFYDPLNPNNVGGVGSGSAPVYHGVNVGPAGPPRARTRAAGPTSPPAGPPGAFDPNPTSAQAATATASSQSAAADVDSARRADQDYGTNQHINDQLLALSKDTTTGYGSEGWRKAVGYISGGRISSPDFQTIGAYLDRSAALAAKSMGVPNTNAGLATAAGATGTTEYSAPALQTKVKLAQALNTAQHQYRQGLDKAVGQGPSPDPTAYNQFRSAWADNFDPRLFLMEDAHRRGDKTESADIASKLSAPEKAELQQKRANLLSLAQTGHLPQ